MEIKIFEHARRVDPERWRRLNPTPRQTRAWFVASENYFSSTTHLYVTAWEQGALRAVLPLYDEFDPAYFNVTECYDPMIRRVLTKFRFLCVGSRLGFEAGVIGDPRAASELLAAAVALARDRKADFLAANFCRAPLPGWRPHGLGHVFDAHVLTTVGRSHADFLASFNAKKRHLLRDEASRSTPLFQAPLLGNEDRFLTLRSLSCERNGSHNLLNAAFFTRLAEAFGEDLTLIAAGDEAEWTGACLLLASENEYCAQSIGVLKRDHTYFNLLVHEPLRRAYATGRQRVDLGAACEEAKRRRGATAVPLSAYLRPVSERCALLVRGAKPIARFSRGVKKICAACAALGDHHFSTEPEAGVEHHDTRKR